jgi:hypothetical protein
MTKSRMNHKIKRANSKRNMRGGYTLEQNQYLLQLGFTEHFLQVVNSARVGFAMLLNDFQASNLTPDQYMQETYDNLDINPDDGLTDEESEDDQYGGKKRRNQRKTKKTKNPNKTKKTTRKYKR